MPHENRPSVKGLSARRDSDAAASGKEGKSMLLAIGIDRYQYISGLHNAVRDVAFITEILSGRYQFDKKWATSLVNEEATLGNISRQFLRLVEESRPEDEVLIYFSGHGSYNKALDRGYWIPFDGKPEESHTLFSNSTLVDFVASIAARHVVLIVDSCFSGAFFGGVRKFDVSQRLSSIPSRWVLTSGRNEVVSDGAPGRNSPFAQSLIFHLNANDESAFRITELFPRIIEQVGTNAEQLPQCEPIRNVGHKGGEFVFRLKGEATHIRLPENYQGGPTPGPRPPVGFNWKMALSITALVATILIVWKIVEIQQRRHGPVQSWRKELYERIQPIKGGFIVSRNDSFGYADKDTMEWIPMRYEEAYPFSEGLARVKRNGSYGWADTSGVEVISCIYDEAGDFQEGKARVSLNGRQFLIDKTGQEVYGETETQRGSDSHIQETENEGSQHVSPAPPLLQAGAIEGIPGEVAAGTTCHFSLKVVNTGGTIARGLRVITGDGIEYQGNDGFNLGPGESRTLYFTLNTAGKPAGAFASSIGIRADNVSQSIRKQARTRVTAAGPAQVEPVPPPVLQVRCNLGIAGCQVSFYDRAQKKTIAFTTDSSGNATYAIAESLAGGTVDVHYCGNSLTVRVQEGGCIILPQ